MQINPNWGGATLLLLLLCSEPLCAEESEIWRISACRVTFPQSASQEKPRRTPGTGTWSFYDESNSNKSLSLASCLRCMFTALLFHTHNKCVCRPLWVMTEAFWLLHLALVKLWQRGGHIGLAGYDSVPVIARGQLWPSLCAHTHTYARSRKHSEDLLSGYNEAKIQQEPFPLFKYHLFVFCTCLAW